MKRTLFSAIALMGFAMMVVHSCRGTAKVASDADTLSFDTIKVDTVVAYNDKNDSPSCELKLNILCAKGPNADGINDSIIRYVLADKLYDTVYVAPEGRIMRQVVDSFVSSYIKDYKKDCDELATAGLLGASSNYAYQVNTTVINGRTGVVTYLVEGYLYTGGAHGMSFTKALNFETATGKYIGKGDAFANTADSTVKNKIVDKLLADYKVKDIEQLKKVGVFAFGDTYVPDNFILGPDSVTFIYMSDEIAPHALGEIRVSVAYNDLSQKTN